MDKRGHLESAECSPETLSTQIKSLKLAIASSDKDGPVHWVVQELVSTRAKGHLSNERRVAEDKRDWVAEVEASESYAVESHRISLRTWRDTGMAFPVAGGRVISAFHIFSKAKVGSPVRLGTVHGMGEKVDWQRGEISFLDSIGDVAIIKTMGTGEGTLPPLVQCESPSTPGTPVIVVKPGLANDFLVTWASYKSITTALKTMPIVKLNPSLPESGLMRNQRGLSRLVAAGAAAGGASGGAIWDGVRRCVIGITSASISIEYLEDGQSTKVQAGSPPHDNLLIGALIPSQ